MKRLLSYRIANLQGQGARDYQEDSFAFANALDVTLIKQMGLLAVVADGMGGMEGGKPSSELAVKTLVSDFENMDRRRDLSGQLAESARKASSKVYDLIGGRGGCTLAACIIFQEMMYFVSVGDSFIWLFRNGELIKLNKDHNRKNEIYLESIREQSMDPQPGRNHFEAAALTQFIGMGPLDDIDMTVYPLPLKDGDTVVICSDGVGGSLTEAEAIASLTGKTADMVCLAMDGLIKEKNNQYQDNYTALVIQCGY
ncbi:MAG: serine/threonine-protein phosphatase [Lachnospiraceae bacterium]|nr:serine/threonine-protein phosphatase [Lachnospiraceae bacterium]